MKRWIAGLWPASLLGLRLPNKLSVCLKQRVIFCLIQSHLFCLIQRVTFLFNTESNFICLIQRVIFMYWYEIGCHAITFFLSNFWNIFFASFLPLYIGKIYSKLHQNWLSGCGEKRWTDVHSHATAYFTILSIFLNAKFNRKLNSLILFIINIKVTLQWLYLLYKDIFY